MIDERNTLFSRIGLTPGTEAHTQFYREHPSYAAADAPLHGVSFTSQLTLDPSLKTTFLQRIQAHTDWIVKEHHRVVKRAVNPQVRSVQTHTIKEQCTALGAVDVQIIALNHDDYYSHHGTVKDVLGLALNGVPIEPKYPTAILFAFKMDETPLHQSPYAESLQETMRVYTQVAHTAFVLTEWLKDHGYDASAQHREFYELPLVPLAHKHRFGTVGMANHMLHPEFGNAIRLGAVLTTAPLQPEVREAFDVRRFCRRCALCLMNCPTQAIKAHEKPNTPFYRFDEHRCFTMFQGVGTDCSLCLSSCPFSSPVLNATVLNSLKDDAAIDAWFRQYLTQLGRKRRPVKPSTVKERGTLGINL